MSTVCTSLYESYIFFPREDTGYVIQQIILSVISIIIIILLYYWLHSREGNYRRGNFEKANNSFLFVYRNIIIFYIIIMSIQFLILLFYILLVDLTKIVSVSSIFSSILSSLIYILIQFQLTLITFLFTKNTLSRRAFIRSIRISLVFVLFWYIFNILNMYYSSIASICSLVVSVVYLFCCCLLIIRQCSYHWNRRHIINRYVLIIIIIIFLNIFISILEYNNNDSLCIYELIYYFWYLIYPFLLIKTIKDDSKYWWKSSSKPLLESTKESLAAIDLFTINDDKLKPAKSVSVANNDDNNNDELLEKFNKLSQIISSHVNMISWKQIALVNDQIGSIGGGTIGRGSTSKVYHGRWKKKDVAVKCLLNKLKMDKINWNDLTLIFRESILSSSVTHANIIKFYGASLTLSSFYLIYEYCSFGDLQEIIVENIHSTNPNISSIYQRLFYLRDITEGMKFLHLHKFVHRDLKTANVVVKYSHKTQKYVAKICDFGVSRRVNDNNISVSVSVDDNINKFDDNIISIIDKQQTSSFNDISISFTSKEIERTIDVGTPAFLAPEILLKLVKKKGIKFTSSNSNANAQVHDDDPLIYCDFATDVYSFGMILWSLITSKLPYKGYKPMDMILMIKKSKRLKINDNEWNKWIPYVNDIKHLKLLLSSTWSQYSNQRPSFKQIAKLLNKIAPDQFK